MQPQAIVRYTQKLKRALYLVLQTDVINGNGGNDLIIGDNGLMVTPVVAIEGMREDAANPLDVGYKDVKKALDSEDKVRDKLLKDHKKYDHSDFHKRMPKHKDLDLIPYRSGYDYFVGNDGLYGGAGKDVITGDMGLVIMPSILEGPDTKHEAKDLNHDVNHLVNDVDDLMRDPFSGKQYLHVYHHKHRHHSSRGGPRQRSDQVHTDLCQVCRG